MPIYLATLTLNAIEHALIHDQGASFRELQRTNFPNAEDAYQGENPPFRRHLGASILGDSCERKLWYSFHWTTSVKFDGKTLRLFNRGHLEEPRFVSLLQMIGCTVYQYDENGKQFRVNQNGGHSGGSLDCVVVGCPDIPHMPILGEFKTHSAKSFEDLVVKGVQQSKPEHYAQTQMYMGGKNLQACLYLAVNKNTDALYGELIPFNQFSYNMLTERANRIIFQPRPAPRISETPGYYLCRFCDHWKVCHMKSMPTKNCRTCQYSIPDTYGGWRCTHNENQHYQGPIPIDVQMQGCHLYSVNPMMWSA